MSQSTTKKFKPDFTQIYPLYQNSWEKILKKQRLLYLKIVLTNIVQDI